MNKDKFKTQLKCLDLDKILIWSLRAKSKKDKIVEMKRLKPIGLFNELMYFYIYVYLLSNNFIL